MFRDNAERREPANEKRSRFPIEPPRRGVVAGLYTLDGSGDGEPMLERAAAACGVCLDAI
jgi:hypothetical protein